MIIESALWMCIMRSIFAVGYSFVQVCAVSLIAQAYPDENKRGTIMGIYNGSMSFLSSVVGIIGGNLAAISPAMAYRTYWAFIPIFIMALFLVPNFKNDEAPQELTNENAEKATKTKEKLGGKFWRRIIFYSIYNFSYCVPCLLVSVLVAENALGTEATIGYLNTVLTITGFVLALAFGFLFGKLKGKLSTLGYTFALIAVCLIYFHPSIVTAFIAFALFGASYNTIYTFAFTYFPSLVPQSKVNDAIGLVSSLTMLANFATTYIITWVMKATGWTLTQSLVIGVILITAVIIVDAIFGVKEKAFAAEK